MNRFDKPTWNPGDTLRSMSAFVRVMGAEALAAIDRKMFDRINPPDEQDHPRYYLTGPVERPVELEEELDGQYKLW